jgi:Alpha/beta hydrolase of unknown function (DUF900)
MHNRDLSACKLLLSFSMFIVAILFFNILSQSISYASAQPGEIAREPPVLTVFSTRIIPTYDPVTISQAVDYTVSKLNGTCPSEIAVYVHGFNRDQATAGEEFNRLQLSLNQNNYSVPLIGFSWISNTDWEKAKMNAKNSGQELANFIIEFKKEINCPDTEIRIIAHSLGASVVESTLTYLDFYRDSKATNDSKIVESVHLLGAAIDNKLIAENSPFANAIVNVVANFYNLYDHTDDGLEFNKLFEKHDPLGLLGAPTGKVPVNYNETDVADKIIAFSDADGDGNLEECFEEYKPVLERGDNHCGYIGFRNPFPASLIDDGVIDILVKDWKES